jgi:hypothetical protein
VGTVVCVRETGDDNVIKPLLSAFAQEDPDLIIDSGFVEKEPVVLGDQKGLSALSEMIRMPPQET